MATHSSVPAWVIPSTGEPGGLWSIGSQIDTTEVTQHSCTHIPYFSATRGEANTPVPGHRLLPVHDEIQSKGLDRELCSMLCGSLVGRGVWGRVNTWICMAELLNCSAPIMILKLS